MLSVLDKEELLALTRSLFQTNHTGECSEPSIDNPIYGSCHVVFPLRFENGPRWAIMILIDGVKEKWSELSSFALT